MILRHRRRPADASAEGGLPLSDHPQSYDRNHIGPAIRVWSLMMPPLMAALASGWVLDRTPDANTAAIREESAARQVVAPS
ncbi:hypothetical protein [Microvirga makkahensis]|uniref:Uncharacterized protein n=1 Tax=Microvirga makkahensis TaxID=1128670 RepID=A0A7X3SPM1_9HYPH|nr:hypothetical protein [Microvirga makkahensis]MXQ12636.1 hypothetical protein [Microvirga makkahensis]